MEVTSIVIGADAALGVAVTIVGSALSIIISGGIGLFAVYRASANAHSNILSQLCDIKERLSRIEERVGIEKNPE